jgi:cytochrome b561
MSECCPQHGNIASSLQKIEDKLDAVLLRLSTGDTTLAVMELRVTECEEKITTIHKALAWAAMFVVGGVAAAVLKVVLV